MSDVKLDLKMKELDQLHNVTMQFSKTSLELKKIYISLIMGLFALCLRSKILSIKSTVLLFIIISASFCFLDAYNYYYQEKTRHAMKKIKEEIMSNDSCGGMGLKLNRNIATLKRRAVLNYSNIIYLLPIVLSVVIA